jgi:class 3 adenylate cyclase
MPANLPLSPMLPVLRAFAFFDLCSFTDFVNAAGDAAAVEELSHLRPAVREMTPLFGVRVDKWLGDEAMLVGVESELVVGATVAIGLRFARIGRLPLRAGIASGAVLMLKGDDYVGRPVNLASRLCDGAHKRRDPPCRRWAEPARQGDANRAPPDDRQGDGRSRRRRGPRRRAVGAQTPIAHPLHHRIQGLC